MPIEKTVQKRSLSIAVFLLVTCVLCTGGVFASFSVIPGAEFGQGTDSSLTITEWQLISYDSGPTQVPVAAGSKITLKFNKDGSIGGSGGINRYFGSYTQNSTALIFGPLGCTEMAGPEPLMNQESTYFLLLDSVRSGHTKGDKLELSGATGRVVLIFMSDNNGNVNRPSGMNHKTILPGTEWQLSSYSDGNAVVSGQDINTVTLKFDHNGNLAGFSGVNTYFGSYKLVGTIISIGPLASTKMAGPEPLMALETVYLNLLESVTGVILTCDSLSLTDKDGKVVLVFGKKYVSSQGQYNAFFSQGTSSTIVSPGTGRKLPPAFIEGRYSSINWSSSMRAFPKNLLQPGRGNVTIPTTGNHQRPSFMPRFNDSIIPPVTYPGGPFY